MDGGNIDKNLQSTDGGKEENISDQKTMALLSWIFPLLGIIFFFLPDTKKKSFLFHHARQATGYVVASFVLSIVLSVVIGIFTYILSQLPTVGSVLSCLFSAAYPLIGLGFIVIQIIMAIAAYKGERKKLPYIGDKIEEILK